MHYNSFPTRPLEENRDMYVHFVSENHQYLQHKLPGLILCLNHHFRGRSENKTLNSGTKSAFENKIPLYIYIYILSLNTDQLFRADNIKRVKADLIMIYDCALAHARGTNFFFSKLLF